MDFSDDRGQALQVGAILLFGILIVGLALYQATIVPDQNERVEFESYLDASDDMERLENEIGAAAARDYSTRTAVRTGVNYPTRTVFVNPGPPGNRLRTTDADALRIANATAVNGEESNTAAYWNGSAREYETSAVRFDTNYNQLDVPPVVYEGGVLYRPADPTAEPPYGPDESIVLSDGTAIEGDRMTLVAVEGDLDAGGMAPTVVAQPVSAHSRTVVVEGNGSDITVTLPSRLADETWKQEVVDGEIDAGSVLDVRQNGSTSVDVVLNGSRTFELRLATVELRRQANSGTAVSTRPEYVIGVGGDGQSISENQSTKLTAEVRDRYNNPKRGVEVAFSTSDGTFTQNGASTRTVTTDGEGRATAQFEPGSTGELEVIASIDGGANADLNATTFAVSVGGGDGSDGGSSGSGGETTNPSSDLASLVWQRATVPKNGDNVSVTFENTASSEIQMTDVRYQFYSIDSQGGGSLENPPQSFDVTDADGSGTTSRINYVGPYVDVDSELDAIAAGDSPTYTFKFYTTENGGNRFDADAGDFFMISVKYELDGTTNTVTYFVGITQS